MGNEVQESQFKVICDFQFKVSKTDKFWTYQSLFIWRKFLNCDKEHVVKMMSELLDGVHAFEEKYYAVRNVKFSFHETTGADLVSWNKVFN